jgi:hypothetical protein
MKPLLFIYIFLYNIIIMNKSIRKTIQKRKNVKSYRKYQTRRNKMNCSPMVNNKTVNNNTCFTVDVLMKIKNEYNKNHLSNQITETEPNIVWNILHEKMNQCDREDCWLKEISAHERNEIHNYIFAPNSPPIWKKNKNEWLSNIDIEKVMNQYEKTYHCFTFIGPVPIDFDSRIPSGDQCVTRELCDFSLSEQLKNKKHKIGIIFNLDKHNEKGSHWVSLFIDVKEQVIIYFDSVGDKIPNEILVLKDRIVKQGLLITNNYNHSRIRIPIQFSFYQNYLNNHQKGNSECGMYSLFFIITMLTDTKNKKKMNMKEKLELFNNKSIPDKYVEKYRNIYFNSN